MNQNLNKYMKLILLPLFWLACATPQLTEEAAMTETHVTTVMELSDDIIPLNIFFHFN